jgi:hypothetical protein
MTILLSWKEDMTRTELVENNNEKVGGGRRRGD